MSAKPPPHWRFSFSPTLKGIYLIRYLMFSGGLAVAGGMLQRYLSGGTHVALGLFGGLAVGLFAFRGQLRPFRLPELVLGQEHLFFVRGGKVLGLVPWARVRSVRADERQVTVELTEPAPGPDGQPVPALELNGIDYGATPNALMNVLREYADPFKRGALLTDFDVRKHLALPLS